MSTEPISPKIEDLPNVKEGDGHVQAPVTISSDQVKEEPVKVTITNQQQSDPQRAHRTSSWNFMWDTKQDNATHSGITKDESSTSASRLATSVPLAPGVKTEVANHHIDYREQLLERREREFDRREREIDRRERELERRERELERRQREFDQDKARRTTSTHGSPQWQEAIDNLKNGLERDILAERKKAVEREVELEARIMTKVDEVLEKERQFYGLMRMSDNEVNAMVESSVGYLLQNDEEIADRVRFQSLIFLSQEKLASQAGLQPPQGSDSLSLAWKLALGPSVVTEERYKKAIELLENKDLEPGTRKLMEHKQALEYVVEYTLHLRKDGVKMSDHSFTSGRIPREDYMETVRRQSKENEGRYEALKALVDFICPEV